MTPPDPGRHLLDRIDAREQALAREAEQAQAAIDEAAARLRELQQEISDLQVTRKTLLRSPARKTNRRQRKQRRPRTCPSTRPTGRSSTPSPNSAARSGPATSAPPWTCRSRRRTPRASGQS